MTLPDPAAVVPKLFDLYGGKDKFFEAMDNRQQEFFKLWDHDSENIGRVLHAHLVVEYFLTAHLQTQNPKLGDLSDARLNFAQKVALIGDGDRVAQLLKPGLLGLNKVRNRLAHKLKVEIEADDIQAIFSIDLYAATLKQKHNPKTEDPFWVLEDFAQFSGTLLQSSASSDSALWAKAFEDA
ncbi:MAG: hypothetical protein M0P59_04125 [Gallionella sp.]|jgi:hypothetical protein|nr:hypothetical protein [Gallionella sp.]MCK9353327.1 hypothetical protein [Gallionella sp.]